ncbi:MAG: hypothetical protein F4X98_01085 [Gammaproteobacteria bacterium]|nr:hypothetical protein [Gammaproteobacteria bacterium]
MSLLLIGSSVTAWSAEDDAGQKTSIFEANTDDWNNDDHEDTEQTEQIWKPGAGCQVRGRCRYWGTNFIIRHIETAVNIVGETSLGAGGNLNVVLFETGTFLASRDSESETIRLRGSWRGVQEGGPIGHELGHAFFDKYLQHYKGGASDEATEETIEASGLTEGVAYILQDNMPDSNPRIPIPTRTVQQTLAHPHSTTGRHRAKRHELGYKLYWAYRRLANKRSIGREKAREAFFNAVRDFDDINADGKADFLEFREAVLHAMDGHAAQVIDAFNGAKIPGPESSASGYSDEAYTWTFDGYVVHTLSMFDWSEFECTQEFGTRRYLCRRSHPVGD